MIAPVMQQAIDIPVDRAIRISPVTAVALFLGRILLQVHLEKDVESERDRLRGRADRRQEPPTGYLAIMIPTAGLVHSIYILFTDPTTSVILS